MKYEEPIIELILFERQDVVRTSLELEGGGGGPDVGDDGDQGWN